jgi:ATP-dependent exoDNAse (exonuclease V) beta subunit
MTSLDLTVSLELFPILSQKNKHERDQYINFDEPTHTYTIDIPSNLSNAKYPTYTSVTTWIHDFFESFDADKVIEKMMKGIRWKPGHKYWGMTAEQIKDLWDKNKNSEATVAGTQLHFRIECFYNDKRFHFTYSNKELYEIYMCHNREKHEVEPLDWKYFIQFVKDYPQLEPYRTEWTVFHEEAKIAGSIDMVFKNEDGTLSIYDWKRSKLITRMNNYNQFAIHPCICHFPNSNFWHYALQLNIYKYILESKYNVKIRDLYLVRLHPDAEEKMYELIELPILHTEVHQLFQERIRGR